MLNLYSRRAFVLLALAIEPIASPCARAQQPQPPPAIQPTQVQLPAPPVPAPMPVAPPTLWDVLSRIETPDSVVKGSGLTDLNATFIRHPLGPIPGMTLAGSEVAIHKKHSGFFGRVADWFDEMETKTGTKIKATGNSTFSLQQQNISGSSSAFQSDQYLGRGSGGFYNDTDISVDATLFKWFHYTTRISNSLMKNPNDNRVKADYHTKNTRVEYGDINVGFQGNSLIDFSKYLHGMQFSETWSPMIKTTVLYSQTKAATQTIVLNGNNSAGPYYVYAGQIVDGSAQVRVDNQVLTPGTDYTLDSFNGQLNFLKNRIILQTDSIAVSFETLGAAGSQGFVYGGKAAVTPNKRWSFGVTWVTQTAQGTSGNQTLTEQFQGYTVPSLYTTNQPIDQTKPINISVSGLPLSPSQYSINKQTASTNQIYIYLAIPQTDLVTIQYSPIIASIVPGDRSVAGVDARYNLGALGSLSLETALSGLSVSNQNINGHAWLGRATINPFKKLHTVFTYKSVSPTFSSIQSPGFTQNERMAQATLDYNPTNRWKFNLDVERASRPTYTGTTQFTVNPSGNDSFTQYSAGTSYTLSKAATVSFNRSDASTKYALGGQSQTGSDTLSYTQTIKSVGLDFAFNDNVSNVTTSNALLGITGSTASSLTTSDSSSYGGRVGLRWQATKALSLTSSMSLNQITTSATGTPNSGSTAKDAQISANYTGWKKVRVNYSLDLSDTGSTAISSSTSGTIATPITTTTGGTTTNTVTTPGSIYGGGINSSLGGFGNTNNVVNNSTGFTSFGGRSLTNRVQLEVSPRKGVQVGLTFDNASSIGDYQYNNDRTGIGLNFNWQASEKFTMTANYNIKRRDIQDVQCNRRH